MKERSTLKINLKGHLEIGGVDTVDLVAKFGTPLYVMDEAFVRSVAKGYKKLLDEKYGDHSIMGDMTLAHRDDVQWLFGTGRYSHRNV